MYLDEEHKNKKKKPFDFDGWSNLDSDVGSIFIFILLATELCCWQEITPQQENCYDCGVFTCHFLEALSRGEEQFEFSQKNMPYLRQRMLWEIGRARLTDHS